MTLVETVISLAFGAVFLLTSQPAGELEDLGDISVFDPIIIAIFSIIMAGILGMSLVAKKYFFMRTIKQAEKKYLSDAEKSF